MDFIKPKPQQVRLGLRAMKQIATAQDGTLDELSRRLLNSIQKIIMNTNFVLDELEEITPSELAIAFPQHLRLQLCEGMILVASASGEVTPAKMKVVLDYAKALSIESKLLNSFSKLANKHIMLFRFDYIRTTAQLRSMKDLKRKKGSLKFIRELAAALNLKGDWAIARPYQKLGLLAPKTVGRKYWEYIRSNDFSFPGEPGSPPEAMLRHDLSHILGDYDTTPEGELQVASFCAGYLKQNSMSMMMFAVIQFHLGIGIAPVTPPQHGHFEPEKMLTAFKRGLAMKHDLFDSTWEPKSILDRPIDEVRKEFNIY